MKTITEKIELFLHSSKYSETGYDVRTYDASSHSQILISKNMVEITMEIPDDFDPIKSQVNSLEAEKKKIEAESYAKVKNIDEQIQRLVCIEHKE